MEEYIFGDDDYTGTENLLSGILMGCWDEVLDSFLYAPIDLHSHHMMVDVYEKKATKLYHDVFCGYLKSNAHPVEIADLKPIVDPSSGEISVSNFYKDLIRGQALYWPDKEM